MANDGTGAYWDESDPGNSANVSDGAKQIRDARIGTRIRAEYEHSTYGSSNAGGVHKAGSAMLYTAANEAALPTVRPDGSTLFTTSDAGRLGVTLDTGLLYYLKNVSGTMTWTKFLANASFSQVPENYVLIRDNNASLNAGTFTAGIWTDRALSEETFDAGNVATLDSANKKFTLIAGTYRFRITAPAYQVGRHQARLYNLTDSTIVAYGTSELSGQTSGVITRSEVIGRLTISGSKDFKIQHLCYYTMATTGLGSGSSNMGLGALNIFTTAEFWKEF